MAKTIIVKPTATSDRLLAIQLESKVPKREKTRKISIGKNQKRFLNIRRTLKKNAARPEQDVLNINSGGLDQFDSGIIRF